ncbi:AMP-binding protein [Pseudorhodoplanes sinuspersici]|uniref:AMP-dependent synthetase n=1 Tax=Pseudorhodoplanes sinuspersici TaxID=1235591 RepID=A0A1W6ZSC0_9HYPH|nr:AMP-binding protein [Pseudorhodoplanes sinuspersici]ARP99644.1 AMP-dependent synthetase [Pseudorhodoplanes sinuspersici]RKE70620.1 long-chain acyl-CoA synthetase [Pseudorhodoplanes sinuspersici]
MNLAQHLHDTGRKYSERPALGFGTAIVSNYATLAKRVARLASALRDEFDLAVGDRVAIASSNTPEYLETLYAIWHAGCVGVPANAKLHGAELAYILEHSGARVCFASSDLASTIEAHAPHSLERIIVLGGASYQALLTADAVDITDRQPDDLAWLFYTSGTTGKPKGAMLTHRNLTTMARAYQDQVDPISPGDSLLHAAPMSHGSGLYMIPYVMHCGLNIVPESGGFDPAEIFKLIEAWPRSSMFAAPTMVKRLVDHSGDCRAENIRTIIWGGAPMYVEDTVRAIDRFGPRFAQIYGQGESPMTITVLPQSDIADRRNPHWRERLASAGRAFSCTDVIIGDENGQPVPQGVSGEILVRGDPVMAGYWQNEEASVAALQDGYLHTGDVGALDANGYLFLKDRSKDLIISGGSNIYPREVEEVLLRHPGVREVSVIGRPDREWGEVVVAYVVGDASPVDLDSLCLNAIARFKRPKKYIFVDTLPKNNYGKVLKTVLRERESGHP